MLIMCSEEISPATFCGSVVDAGVFNAGVDVGLGWFTQPQLYQCSLQATPNE